MKKNHFFIFCLLLSLNGFSQNFQEFDVEPNGESNPFLMVYLNNKVIFWANTQNYGNELWAYDSLTQSTMLVKDINPGSSGCNSGYVDQIVFQNKLFFTVDDGTHGYELWVSDGTTAGTYLLKDIDTIPNSGSYPSQFFIFNNELYFNATSNNEGTELWKTDGTTAGTVIVKDINPGVNGSFPNNFVICNGKLFFSAYEDNTGFELWVTDGTAAGTMLVKDLTNDHQDGYPYYPMRPICLNNVLIFVGRTDATGSEIFKSDGTAAGTQLVKDINLGPDDSYAYYAQKLGNTIVFSAYDNTNGQELWKTDGTTAGTQLLKDIFPGSDGSYPVNLFLADSIVVFQAENMSGNNELWKTNGSETVLLKDIKPMGASFPDNFFLFNNKLFFTAEDALNGRELWISDGTTNGTTLFKNINTNPGAGSFPNSFTIHNNELYFIADIGPVNNENYQLFKSDGTASGTTQIQPFTALNPFNLLYFPFFFTSTPFGLFFKANYNPANGFELWRYYSNTTSLTSPKNLKNFDCYPNPFVDFVNCDCHSETLEIYSLEGKLLERIKVHEGINTLKLSYSYPVIIKSLTGYQVMLPENTGN